MKPLERFKKALAGDGLKSRALSGGVWLGSASAVEQGLRLLRNIILARLVAPEAFGALAIIVAVNSAFESFTEIGIKEAIVQDERGAERAYLNGAWWLSLTRSVALFIAAYLISPRVAQFYDATELVPMMRLVFLTIVFNGCLSLNAYVALKKMDYRRWVAVSQGGGALGVVTTIILTFFIHNVWALVIGYLSEAAFRCILSYLICPFRPGIKFEKDALRALFRYSSGMFGLPILFFVFAQADVFVVGKLFTKDKLGLYSMAVSLAATPALLISVFINPIMMPLISGIKASKGANGEMEGRINGSILKATALIAFVGLPLALFMALYGKDVLEIVYGARYREAGVPFSILFATTLLRTSAAPIATAYLAIGEPHLHRLFALVRALLMAALIYPLVRLMGLPGAALSGLAAMSAAYVLQARRIRGLTGLSLSEYAACFKWPAIVASPVIAVWALTYDTFSVKPSVNITIGTVAGCIVYAALLAVFMQFRKRGYTLP